MNQATSSRIGLVLCGSLLACTTYAQPSVSIGVSVPLPAVEIRTESDFYEPLTPYGEWVAVGSYGRCWRPRRVEAGWRPYCNGYWQRTDAGWYWVSDEPWAWAAYHYGRWDFTEQYGWYWVPQTQWAPAWVSWHSGGGYIGWAPLLPAVRIAATGYVGFSASLISPRAFVFVEQRRFLDPVRPATVVANNTTIINKTTTITNTKIVNNTVINEGPTPAVVEKESGRKIQAVPVQELRHKTEAAVVTKQRTPQAASEEKASVPAPPVAQAPDKQPVVAREAVQVAEPPAATHASVAPAPNNRKAQTEKERLVPAVPELKSATNHAPAIKAATEQKAAQNAKMQEKPVKSANKKAQPPPKGKPDAVQKNGADPADKDHEKKVKE